MGLSGSVTHPAGRLVDKFVLRFFFLVLVDEIHQRLIDIFQLFIVVDGDEDVLAVFFDRFQNADLSLIHISFAEDGFRFMIPYYQYFEQIYRMAD